MYVVLVTNIGISTSISNTTQIRSQHFTNFMCVHGACAGCQCQISEQAPAYPTLHKDTHSTSQTSCVSTGNVRGASAKYRYQHQHIQHYTNTPTALQNLHVYPLGMCVAVRVRVFQCNHMPNISLNTSTFQSAQICVHNFINFVCLNVRGARAKYVYQHQHIQHYTNTHTALQKVHVCPLGMCVVLVPNIGISTSISNTTQRHPQQFTNFMCVHWECAGCQCQISVLAPAYPTLHKYAHSTSQTSCVSSGNVRGASAKYRYQHQHIQQNTNTPTVLHKLHVCPLGMCVVLVHILVLAPAYPTLHKYAHSTLETSCVSTGNVRGASAYIGISTSISNTTQIRPQHFRNFMCVHWECAWCQCIYWYQHQHIQHYTHTPTALHKLHVCPLGMCRVLVPNIGISTSISNTTQIRPKQLTNFMYVHWEYAGCYCQIWVLAPAYPTLHKYAHSTSQTSCVSTGNVRGASDKYRYQHQHIQHYTNTHTALQKVHVCPLGMCVVLVPNIGISTSISNRTQRRPQRFTNFMCVHCECAWCQCQILVLAPAYPTLHKYAHSTSETSCVSSGNVCGTSNKYWYQHQHIQHYTNTPTALHKLHVCPLGMCVVLVRNIGISTTNSNNTQIRPQHFINFMCIQKECAWCQCQILVLARAYPTLHKCAHSSSETSCVSTGNVRGASDKYWYQHQHIQHYTNTPTALQKLHVCPLEMCVVLVTNIGISTSISNITQIFTSTTHIPS